ncbi:MAG: ribosome small subunit-dependent GTPase A [Firmicutes bacterium]|nr:ribosome small subunit-dependent GTPase A [Bacillota bacterium]
MGEQKLRSGIVISSLAGFYDVEAEGEIITCRARGILRKQGISPCVGDYVDISGAANNQGMIETVKPRKNQLYRPVVANIDLVVIILSVTNPEPDYLLLEKLIILARHRGMDSVVCFNKVDLAPDVARELVAKYQTAGNHSLAISALSGDGIDQLVKLINRGTAVLAGQSGVGKSRLAQALTGRDDIVVGEVSKKNGRGRHTTRQVRLLKTIGGGRLADTPGFSSLQLEDIDCRDLAALYPEIIGLKTACRFNSCTHVEEPGCALRAAVDSGVIPHTRYENYLRIFCQVREKEESRY